MTRILFVATLTAGGALAQAPPPVPTPSATRPAAARPATRAAAGATVSHTDLKFGPMRVAEPPRPVRAQLSNGMTLLLLEDHETPRVTATALVRTGSAFDPPDKSGLAAITGSLVRNGGTGRRAPERVDAELESYGARLETSVGEMLATVTLTALKENAAEALALYRDVLADPAFRQDRVDFARALTSRSIARRNDDAGDVLRRELQVLLYGRGGAFGRAPDYASVGRISRADVNAFYRRYFFPANITLAVCGDFDAEQMKGALEALFGAWKSDQKPAPLPEVKAEPTPGGFVAVKPEMRETLFAAGVTGPAYNAPESAALEVAAAVLGGNRQSRIARRAQETPGVLREIQAEWVSGFGRPGALVVSGAGASAAAGDTIRMILDEAQKLRAAEPTDDELRAARETVMMKHVAGLNNRAKALSAAANLEYFGYGADSMAAFLKAVAGVSRADVLRVAKEWLDPAQFTVLAVSNQSVFTKPLDPRGGETTKLNLAAPAAAPAATAAAASAVELGKRVLARARQASGGADQLAAVKDYVQTAAYQLQGGGRETQTDQWLAPGHLRQDLQSSVSGRLVRYANAAGDGWISNGRESRALTGFLARQARDEVFRAYIALLLSDSAPGRSVVALDEQTIEIAEGEHTARLVFDPQTGLPANLLYEVQGERPPGIFAEETYSDFRDVNGIRVPFGITVTHNGIRYADGTVTDFKINQGLKVEVMQRRP